MDCRFLGRELWRALPGASLVHQRRGGGEPLVLWKGVSASLDRLLERPRWPRVLWPFASLDLGDSFTGCGILDSKDLARVFARSVEG